MNVIDFGDNMVGFMSQIGWKEDGEDSPSKKVRMERIFADVDTSGGNGGEVFIWEAIGPGQFGNNILHTKMPHREAVFRKIDEYLAE